jgi:signal transduction histidine kinase
LTNVARHAEASHVWVSLSSDDADVSVSVEDDGVGFDREAAHGTGLIGIRDRFAMLDGHVEILTAPGRGVRVEGALPLKASLLSGGVAR